MKKRLYNFVIRKMDPRKVKRKGGIDGLQTDYEVLTIVLTGKKHAKLLAKHLNEVVQIHRMKKEARIETE